jgi:hypothetical protein|tara:strand:+ start:935 stop:1252 length:318 start_codon:yes stop_codon:yes gene_type:complete
MAITKTLIKAVPYEISNEVETWELQMKYENDSEGDATYYTSTFSHTAVADDSDFTKAAKGTFNLAALTALCPVSHWDVVFASQVNSVITNPVVNPVPDTSFAVPS